MCTNLQVELTSSKTNTNKFERGQKDVFTIECVDLGDLTRARVWHDDKHLGSDWFLDKIEVEVCVYMESVSDDAHMFDLIG